MSQTYKVGDVLRWVGGPSGACLVICDTPPVSLQMTKGDIAFVESVSGTSRMLRHICGNRSRWTGYTTYDCWEKVDET